MLARAAALVRDHPLLTPLLIVYAAINVVAGIFAYTPWLAPVNLLLLVAYVLVIHFATRGRQLAMPDAWPPNARSRDLGLATTVAVLQLAAVAVVWFLMIPHGLPKTWAADLKAAGVPTLIAGKAANVALTIPLLLLPTLVAVACFRVRAREVGLTVIPRDLALGVGLAAMGAGRGTVWLSPRWSGAFSTCPCSSWVQAFRSGWRLLSDFLERSKDSSTATCSIGPDPYGQEPSGTRRIPVLVSSFSRIEPAGAE